GVGGGERGGVGGVLRVPAGHPGNPEVDDQRTHREHDDGEDGHEDGYCSLVTRAVGTPPHQHHDQLAPEGGVCSPPVSTWPTAAFSIDISTLLATTPPLGIGVSPVTPVVLTISQTTRRWPLTHPPGS